MPETRHDQMKKDVSKFHKKNPEVWRLFVKFTMELVRRGFKHHSAKSVFERIRWETIEAATHGEPVFKLTNNHHAFYARRFMNRYPQFAPSAPDKNDGFFRLRKQKSKLRPAVNQPPLTPEDFE